MTSRIAETTYDFMAEHVSLPQSFPNLASPKKQLVATVLLPLMEILYTLENIANTHKLLFVMRTTKICFHSVGAELSLGDELGDALGVALGAALRDALGVALGLGCAFESSFVQSVRH